MSNKLILYILVTFDILILSGLFLLYNFLYSSSAFNPENIIISYSSKKSAGLVLGESTNKSNPGNHKDITYRIPVLMYHYIRDFNDPNDQIGTNLSVSPQKFEEQLKWLKDNGYRTVNFDTLSNRSLPTLPTGRQAGQAGFDAAQDQNHKYVILTFDDGYEDAYTNAFPILKRYGFTATFYIITNYVDNDNYMTWNQILGLKNAGMNIGSHTLSHPDLSKASLERVEKEISQSKKILEEKIGTTISNFCYPSGKYNVETINLLKKYNYLTATTTKSGIYDSGKNNLYEIPRLRITNQTDLSKILSQ